MKIDNATAARPQTGLADIPLLLEYEVEGGLTRFVAITDSTSTGVLGPVRSLRPVDADLVPLFAPSVATTGGQPFVIKDVVATGATLLEPGAMEGFFLSGAPGPHNVFLDLDELRPHVENLPLSEGFIPSGKTPDGAEANEISIGFADSQFAFEDGMYRRIQDGAPFLVLSESGGPPSDLTHDVLIVIHVARRSAGYTDSNDVEVSTFDVIGSGDLEVFVEGVVVTGRWLRASHDVGYEFFDAAGDPFGVSGERIYVAFAPRGSGVEY